MNISIKTTTEIQRMRDAGKIVGETLAMLEEHVKPGISTLELDTLAENFIRKSNGIPTEKGYCGFPASICASVNEEVVHGIPRADRILQEGDIVSIDLCATFRGYVGDGARTFGVGKISAEDQQLIDVTRQSFFEGMKYATAGNRLGDVSHAIQTYAESFGYGVIRDLVGHGIGKEMHEEPNIPNYGKKGRGPRLYPGNTLAVEPMIAQGHYSIITLADGWTCVMRDGKKAAHYENTILITNGEPELLTLV